MNVWSKADIFPAPDGFIAISANDSDSISCLISLIRERAISVVGDGSEGLLARARHLEALAAARSHVEEAARQLEEAHAGELVAEELRLAQRALDEITGTFSSDDLLGRIFSSFCIGK